MVRFSDRIYDYDDYMVTALIVFSLFIIYLYKFNIEITYLTLTSVLNNVTFK